MAIPYDAILLVSFGGPERPEDVIPFLQNVLEGRDVPRERMLMVAEHYYHFGGVSPINAQNRALIAALEDELHRHGPSLPVYWGNRNWHPMLTDTVAKMAEDGIRRALAFVTSAYSSYSSCRQYREDIQKACDRAGASAPQIDKLRAFYDHPGFIEPLVERVADALQQIPADRRGATAIVYTAHSIPVAMSRGCKYVAQLTEVCRLIGEHVGDRPWQLAYQSRSGPARQPWLEPDVCDYLKGLHKGKGVADVVIAPIGFISDHMEVLFDLDTEARALCDSLGINMVRAQTVGTHPRFVRMIRELIEERTSDCSHREALGCLGPSHDTCPQDCCPSGRASDPR